MTDARAVVRQPVAIKQRLTAGETLFGTFLTLGSPFVAESLGLAGFDFLLVDLEHGGAGEPALLGQLLGASAAGVHALVRVESAAAARAARVLDLGAEGVMCPQVDSAVAARDWVRALHYPPFGTRGVARAVRGTRYGNDPDAFAHARERTLGIAQIESPAAVEAVEQIAAIGGVDVLFLGPSDLSFALGCFGDFGDPRLRAAVTRVVSAANAAGKVAGTFCATAEAAATAVADGFRFIALGTDATLLARAARDALTAVRP